MGDDLANRRKMNTLKDTGVYMQVTYVVSEETEAFEVDGEIPDFMTGKRLMDMTEVIADWIDQQRVNDAGPPKAS